MRPSLLTAISAAILLTMTGATARAESAAAARASSELTLRLPPDAPPAAVVEIDGEAVALGQPLHLTAGKHVIVVRLPDGASRRQEYFAPEGGDASVTLDVPGQTEPSRHTASVAAAQSDAGAPSGGPFRWSSLHIGALTVGGIGAASLIAGGITGGLVFANKPAIEAGCDGPACDPSGKDAADQAQELAAVSTGLLSVGAACAAMGTLMWLLAAGDESESPPTALRPFVNIGGHVAIGVEGAW